jgi:hypothetical protein
MAVWALECDPLPKKLVLWLLRLKKILLLVMLDMLAEDSSDAAPARTSVVAPLPEASKALDIQRPDNVRPKCPCRANQPASPADG